MSRYGRHREADAPTTVAMREREKGRIITRVVPVSAAVLRQRRRINEIAAGQ